MAGYNKHDPNKVHLINGIPFIYNKADRPITTFQAEQQFKKAVHTMHTWAARTFRLASAIPDPEMREYELEHLEWELDNIEAWLRAMRQALENERGAMHEQETIDKLLALAESTTFPEEADNARRMAARRQENQ